MKKSFVFAAVAAVVLSACAKVDTYKVSEQEALTFGVYAGNAAKTTKAVSSTDYGTVTTASLQASAKGFGVFGYYTDADNYASSTKANFMYNQQVTYSSGAWSYSPVKYWPNEHGASAVSSDVDKLTFLAYAPFVANLDVTTDHGVAIADTAATAAAATEGITAMTANNVAGDAVLTFVVPASAEQQIDLLYGVMAAKYTDVEGTNVGTVGGALENLTKQKTNGKVEILFKHALAKVAIDIKDVVDAVDPVTSVDPASDGTKVVVESLTLTGTNLGKGGKLNLYTGAWSDFTTAASYAVNPLPAAIYSGDTAPTAYPTVAGVDEDGLDNTIDLMVVPATGAQITGVQITYYVCTEDAQLDGGVSVVKNVISKDLATPVTINKGFQYNLNVLLGLTSIKLDATVEVWQDGGDTEVDLPENVA